MIESIYKGGNINTVQDLFNILSYSEDYVSHLLPNLPDLYTPNKPKIKNDGSLRQTYTIKEPLKSIQDSILVKIINEVDFSRNLFGIGIDPNYSHSNIANAIFHSHSKTVIQLDVKEFFKSIKRERVFDEWIGLFKFPTEVAQTLTELTTLENELPQGGSTSSAVASLLFFNYEVELIANLQKRDLRYSRYIDDITVSSTHILHNKEISEIILLINNMVEKYGLNLNSKKQKISLNKNSYIITGINSYLGIPKLSHKQKSNIRVEIHKFGQLCTKSSSFFEVSTAFQKVYGKTTYFTQIYPDKGKAYQAEVQKIFQTWKEKQKN